MKKVIVGLFLVGVFCSSAWAVDEISKRQNMATLAVEYSTQLVDALNGLKALKEERAKLGQDFQDSDFTNSDLKYLNAGIVGNLLDFTVTAFDTTYQDSGNGERNKQILNQMRRK